MIKKIKWTLNQLLSIKYTSIIDVIKKDHYYNRTETEIAILYGAFLAAFGWMLFGYVCINYLHHADSYHLRAAISLVLIYYWIVVYFKKYNIVHHFIWILYNILSSFIFPFYFYLENNRNAYSFGTLLFFTIYFASFTRSLDTLVGLFIGLCSIYIIFYQSLITYDYIMFVVIIFTYLTTSVAIAGLRYFRIKDEAQKRKIEAVLKEKQEAEYKFERSATMASLGTLVSGLAHEINNPLMIIYGTAAQLKKYNDRSELIWKKHANAVERISSIIQNLQYYSSTRSEATQLIHLNGLIQSIYSFFESITREANISFVLDVAETENIKILSRESRLQQVFTQILTNAKDAIENSHHKRIMIKTYLTTSSVCIAISDTGCGIERDNLSKIFEPFYTTKAPGSGIGLGLPLTLSIITKLGGQLDVSSVVNQGTVITISLPKTQSNESESSEHSDMIS